MDVRPARLIIDGAAAPVLSALLPLALLFGAPGGFLRACGCEGAACADSEAEVSWLDSVTDDDCWGGDVPAWGEEPISPCLEGMEASWPIVNLFVLWPWCVLVKWQPKDNFPCKAVLNASREHRHRPCMLNQD